MECIDMTRWMMYHFDGDPMERESIRLTGEIFKTVFVLILAVVVLPIVL